MDSRFSPPSTLLAKIREQIIVEERRLSDRRRFALSIACLVAALVAVYPIVNALIDALRFSGFVDLAELVFTNTNIVISNWQDYALGLLESFPALEVALLLSLLAIVLFCIRAAGRRVTSLAPRRFRLAGN